MARRDVDLVIRAKDEAARVVDTITKALKEFNEAQDRSTSSAKKNETALTSLGSAFATLDRALKGMQAAEVVSKQLSDATNSVNRLKASVTGLETELAQQSRALDRAGAITERYAQKLAGAETALRRKQQALAQAKANQGALTAEVANTASKLDGLQRSLGRQTDAIARQTDRVQKAQERYQRLGEEIAKVADPTKTMQNALAAAQRSLDTQTAKLGALRAAHDTTQVEIASTSAELGKLQGRLDASNAKVQASSRAVDAIGRNYAKLKTETRAASQEQRRVSDAVERTTTVLAAQTNQLNRAESELSQIGVAARQTAAELGTLTATGFGALSQDIERQRRATLEAKREWLQATAAVRALAQQIGAVGVPTLAMAEAFQRAKATAAGLKQEYLENRNALGQLGKAFQQARGDVSGIAQAQQRMQAANAALQQSLAALAQRQRQTNAEISSAFAAYRRTAEATRDYSNAVRAAAQAQQQASSSGSAWRRALNLIYGESRQALSLTQRWRGEVLALVASYAGLFAAARGLQEVINAYQTLEAAQSRLNVVFDNDLSASTREFDFLRRNADRLGIELGNLADQYTKFAVATKGTVLEGEKTRKIFLAVAEAARVNKASNDELRGIFLALQQMVSKNRISLEELQRQLGDRLPGAVQIMAAAVGVSTAELYNMIEAGDLTAESLSDFADELDRRFGKALPSALETLTTALGRLRNATFQTLLAFGEAGFLASFQKLVNSLVGLLQSAEFTTFLERVSSAVSTIVDAVSILVNNFQLLGAAVGAFIGLKLAPAIIVLAGALKNAAVASVATTSGIVATGAAAGTAAVAVRGLAASLALLAGPAGIALLVAGLAAGLGYWLTSATQANEALTEHKRIIDLVRNAYDETSGSVADWRKALEDLTVVEAERNLRNLRSELVKVQGEVEALANSFRKSASRPVNRGGDPGARAFLAEAEKLIQSYRRSEITARDLRKQIDELAKAHKDGSDRVTSYAESLNDVIKRLVRFDEAVSTAESVVTAMTGEVGEAERALKKLNGIAEDTAETIERRTVSAVRNFTSALAALRDLAPSLSPEMEKLAAKIGKVETAFQNALAAARALPDAIMRIAAEQAALQARTDAIIAAGGATLSALGISGATDSVQATATILRRFEGFRTDPYWDVNALRIGFGSDTKTDLDGNVTRVDANTRVTVEEANRDLIRRIETEFMPRARAAAGPRFDTFTPAQQAALTSIAYNYGSLPGRVASVIQSGGSIEDIARAIADLGSDNNGVNRNRRAQEAALFGSDTGVEALIEADQRRQEVARREAERAAQEEARRKAATAATIADNEFELQQMDRKAAGLERQAAIEAALRKARAENPNITAEELATIERQAGALFDAAEAERQRAKAAKEALTDTEKAEEATRRVNTLLEYRKELEAQRQEAALGGDDEKAASLAAKIAEVNAEMIEAISNAKKLWEVVGGTEADLAIAKLENARIAAQKFSLEGRQSWVDWKRVGELFVGGLTNAFDAFSKAVAEGKDIGEAARDAFLQFAADFLREIAQMIIRQAILNALQGTKLGGLFGIGVAHSGGVVGSKRAGTGVRRVSPAVFAGAARFHSGGFPGLSPGEVPVIAQRGEEILSRDDPRNVLNGGAMGNSGGGTTRPLKIVNKVSGGEVASAMFEDEDGSEVVMNWFRANRTSLRSILGG
jgi:tape measure domain-containing protein